MNKEIIRQALMLRSKFRNWASQTKMTTHITAYKKQENYMLRLNKESK